MTLAGLLGKPGATAAARELARLDPSDAWVWHTAIDATADATADLAAALTAAVASRQKGQSSTKRWSRPVVADWVEERRRDPREITTLLTGDSENSLAPGQKRLWSRLSVSSLCCWSWR